MHSAKLSDHSCKYGHLSELQKYITKYNIYIYSTYIQNREFFCAEALFPHLFRARLCVPTRLRAHEPSLKVPATKPRRDAESVGPTISVAKHLLFLFLRVLFLQYNFYIYSFFLGRGSRPLVEVGTVASSS